MKKIYSLICISLVLLATNCSKDYLDRFPEDQPSTEDFYNTSDQLVLAAGGAYNNVSFLNGGYPFQMQLDATTDVMWYRAVLLDIQAMGLGQITSNTPFISTVWSQYYTGIGRCNALLENMYKAKAVTPVALYNRVEGEARFLRAYYYGNLIALYGDVPLVTKSLSPSEYAVPKVPQVDVLNLIFSDLDSAAAKLPVSYTGVDIGRATKTAALAFKARMALYYSKWDVAAAASKAVMDIGYHTLYPSYRDLFTYAGEYSKEVIFSYDYNVGIVNSSAKPTRVTSISANSQARNSSGFSNLIPTRAMADTYECTDGQTIDKSPLYTTADPFKNRDPRMRQAILGDGDTWFGTGGITFNMTFHPDSINCTRFTPSPGKMANLEVQNAFSSYSGLLLKKYLDIKDLVLNTQSELGYILIRYAEVLLTYAEAKIEANQIDASVLNAINQVRARGYGVAVTQTSLYPAVTTTNQAELRKIIRRERKVELVGEGLRIFDMRRWKIGEQVMNGILFGKALNKNIYYSLPKPTLDDNSSPDYASFNTLLNVSGNFKIMDFPRVYKVHNNLWPIPQSELDVNKNPGFTQNPGY